MRWLLFAQRGSSIPTPFLVVLVFWLMIIFASFSLFAPPNATVIVTLLVCALSVAGAIFLILEHLAANGRATVVGGLDPESRWFSRKG